MKNGVHDIDREKATSIIANIQRPTTKKLLKNLQ
jgi:hypothetical protein